MKFLKSLIVLALCLASPLANAQSENKTLGGLAVGTPIGGNFGYGSVNANSYYQNGQPIVGVGLIPNAIELGQRTGAPGQQGTIAGYSVGNYACFHERMYFPYGAKKLQLVFPQFLLPSGPEQAPAPSMFQATGVTYSGGTSYVAGEVDTFTVTSSTGIRAVKVVVDAVSSGVPTAEHILDPGLYNTPLAAGASPASTLGFTGAAATGTGATATFSWASGPVGLTVGIEPVFGTDTLSGTNAIVAANKGMRQNGGYSYKQTAMLVPYGEFLVTDPMSVQIKPGTYAGIRMCAGYGTPPLTRLPIGATYAPSAPTANRESAFGQTTFSDLSLNGSMTTTVTTGMLTPLMAIGVPYTTGPTIAALGDSRLVGVSSGTGSIAGSDVLDNDGNISWFEKATSAVGTNTFVVPWTSMARQGDSLVNMVYDYNGGGGENRFRVIQMGNYTAVYQGLNVNDLCGGTSLATLKTYEQQVYERLKGLGIKYVFTDTTDPETTSTDSWATTANQTLSATCSANIIARNDALAAGTWVPYDFFIDNRAIVESAVDSGKWTVTGTANATTGDGVHAAPAIILLKAANAAAVMKANIKQF